MVALISAGAFTADPASPEPSQPGIVPVAPVAFTLDCAAFEAVPAQTGSIEVAVGGDVVVTLCSNASTGYVWADPVVSDPGVLSATTSTAEPASSPMPGAAGTQTFGFHALAAGSATVQLSYSQPWDGGDKDAWTLSLDVTVR